MLVVSKASGILLCEVKDKGHAWEAGAATEKEQQERDAAVAKEIRKAAEQLDDAEKVGHAVNFLFLILNCIVPLGFPGRIRGVDPGAHYRLRQ